MTSDAYAKLFQAILTSSIWSEDDKTRIMWVTLLALCDRDGYVTGTIPGLAAMARMTTADAEKSVLKLMEPDQYSRTPDHEGRRIEQTDGGWMVLNYAKYREIGTKEGRRLSNAERQRRFREKHLDVTESNATVTPALQETLQSNAPLIPIPIPITIPPEDKGGCKGEPKRDRGELKALGEFRRVMLSKAEYEKLCDKHGKTKAQAGIQILDAWLERTGSKRKNHYACMDAGSFVWEKVAKMQATVQHKDERVTIKS